MKTRMNKTLKIVTAIAFIGALGINIKSQFNESVIYEVFKEVAAAEVTTCNSGVWAQLVVTTCQRFVDCDGNGTAETPCGEMVIVRCNSSAPEDLKTCCTESTTIVGPSECCEPE